MVETHPNRMGVFLAAERAEIIARWSQATKHTNAALRDLPEAAAIDGMGLFIDQIAAALRDDYEMSESSNQQCTLCAHELRQ